MERTLRLRKFYRIGAVFGAVVLLGIVGTGTVVGAAERPADEQPFATIGGVAVLVLIGAGAVWLIAALRREQLMVNDASIHWQGTGPETHIDWSELNAANWKAYHQAITLSSPDKKLRVNFNNYEPDESLWLIRLFRVRIPEAIQHDWDLFCHKLALPLREALAHCDRPPGSDEILFSRRRWDWYFIPAILVFALAGLVVRRLSDGGNPLLFPVIPLAMWLTLRFLTPRKGIRMKRLSATPSVTRGLIFLLAWGAIALAGILLFPLLHLPSPYAEIIGALAVLLWFGVVFHWAHRADKARARRDREEAPASVQEWNEGEPGSD